MDAQVELQKEKERHSEQTRELRAELKKWRGIKKVLKDQYKGEVKLLRRRIDDLEDELEGWRNSQHYRAKNGKSTYHEISDVDSSRTLDTNSEANDSRRRLVVDEDDKDVTCRVNWGFLFGGRKRGS